MTEEKPVVYVVDDDPSVLKSLERLLRSAEYSVRTFTSPIEFLDFQHLDAPSCLILDVKMPGLDGLELQDLLVKRKITFPIIFITGHGTVPMSVRAMKAGAVDFLQKPFMDGDLLDILACAIRADSKGRQKQKELGRLQSRIKALTPREDEVFRLVITGMLNKQIAYVLGTSEKTIKVHRARIMEKLRAESLADLVRLAEKLGIGSSDV